MSPPLLVLGAGLAALAACSSEDDCGPGGAPAGDLVASAATTELRYLDLRARANNDCPDANAPAGVISLTLSGTSSSGGAFITFCVPRPDLLAGTRALGVDVQVIDVVGADASCSYRQLRGSSPSGTAKAAGVCGAGRDAAGFSLEIDGEVTLERTCGAAKDSVRATLTGKVAVLPSSN